ncbi:hypothetical protein DYB28_006180 [Aphanomyces astaci]|uniref:Uncharacterized protein n=1 Tax=Aphanomyces astaci TaxID=112090 RepID=A0A397CMB6_APHAT|nr:hypothetical protein DYB34_000127 [Aphanomyces astaci]RHY46424.1 hypothetical protein DYB30_003520 [Aphanomyces astaci]RHY53036.1 hypothetical protein DYB38_000378 [Aphanomyces astaci]RLO03225.1 hypothetical protein DYB28_006180 [Aphanomyces astaci]
MDPMEHFYEAETCAKLPIRPSELQLRESFNMAMRMFGPQLRGHYKMVERNAHSNLLGLIEVAGLIALPIASLFITVLLLRVVFKPKDDLASRKSPNYGTIHSPFYPAEDDSIYAGQVDGNYVAPWTATFDLAFLLSMLLSLVALVACTSLLQPELWVNLHFWLGLAIQAASMLLVSTLGGLVCRAFGIVNDKGYLLTTISATFKVNYTRKWQHFAAYILPLLNPWSFVDDDDDIAAQQLPLLWSYFSILLSFLLLVKPLRERFVWCMIQFNGLDRPDDRPHTLKWLLAGNLVPGFVVVVGLNALFGRRDILLLVVAIAIIGDGLAEPVGMFATRLT